MGRALRQPSSQSGLARRDLRVCADLPSECDCYAWRVQPDSRLAIAGRCKSARAIGIRAETVFVRTHRNGGGVDCRLPASHLRQRLFALRRKRVDTGAATIMGFVGVATLMVLVTMLPYAVFVSVGLLVSVGQLRKVMVCVKSSAA